MKKKKPSLLRSLGTTLSILLVIVVFAYGVQVTAVNFETTRSEIRLTQLKRVLRALARPDIVEYDQVETNIEIPFYLPCPEDQEILIPEPVLGEAHLVSSTNCGSADDIIHVEGYNLPPHSKGPLNFVTTSGVKKPLGDFSTDGEGYFQLDVKLPDRQPVEEAQQAENGQLRAVIAQMSLVRLEDVVGVVVVGVILLQQGEVVPRGKFVRSGE